MRTLTVATAIAVALFLTLGVQAQTPPSVTATCKDGTSFSGTTRRGACHGHGGVQAWGNDTAAGTKSATATPATPAPSKTRTATATPAPAKPHAGTGQVWVNTNSKVYHCPGTTWYRKTKAGTYLSEVDAQAKGYRPDHGKACS